MKKESDLFSHGVCQKCGRPIEVKSQTGLCPKHESQMRNNKDVFDGNLDISDILATDNRLDEMVKNSVPGVRNRDK